MKPRPSPRTSPQGHIMNLGRGIEATTPEEEHAKFVVDTVHSFRHDVLSRYFSPRSRAPYLSCPLHPHTLSST